MVSISHSDFPAALAVMPRPDKPEQLFVLLHGESATPEQLSPLAQAIKVVFPHALIVLPYGPARDDTSTYHWFAPGGPAPESVAAGVAGALPALVAYIRHIQNEYGLTGEQTALAGFSQGATMALEAALAESTLAGRVLAFSGSHVSPLTRAPAGTTLHFLHGKDDTQVPLGQMQDAHARLAELHADATLDVASEVGHELHAALIGQAIHRLQTCVPLRKWEAALTGLAAPGTTTVH